MGKLSQMPPGEYKVVVERSRKVRNKPWLRVHYRVVETGETYSEIIKL